LNIPYIKTSPEEGGTHGIIGHTIIRHCKPDAVILNFARGELVDSMAMKEFLDKGGVYISDFPDDELWNHPNAIIVPHLGASTGEAEDSAAVSVLFFFSMFLSSLLLLFAIVVFFNVVVVYDLSSFSLSLPP
jgi:phosphoglycerate dehydrogenase-like enzyme